METEAKFSVPGKKAWRRIQSAETIAAFTLAEGETKSVHDVYVDTPQRALLAAGYFCRFRHGSGGVRITLKSLNSSRDSGSDGGAIHRREELEELLPASQPPEQWPDSELRQRVLGLTGGAPLLPLFDLRQQRLVRPVRRDEQDIAELSLDKVDVKIGEQEKQYCELEIELKNGGGEDDLQAIAGFVRSKWHVQPEPRSKFERALEMVQTLQSQRLLTPVERSICTLIAARDDLHGKRAQGLLALDSGASLEEASQAVGRTTRTLRNWQHDFAQERLAVFPLRILNEYTLMAQSAAPAITIEAAPQPQTETQPELETQPEPEEPSPAASVPETPGLLPDDSMAEAARKTLSFHFQTMLSHEEGARLGDDIEELHDMRVATRRLRAALEIFEDYQDQDVMAPILKGLRLTGRSLGAVRDLDVFWEKSAAYLATLPPERQNDLAALHTAWQAERDAARQRMIDYFDSNSYARFKERFTTYAETPEAAALPAITKEGEVLARRLRHCGPIVVYRRLATVRAYDEWLVGDQPPLARLHQLRIASKGLRYTLEFFAEVLGPEAKTLIKDIKGLQDHLGNLQDCVVASNILRDFMTWGSWGNISTKKRKMPPGDIVAPGVAAYLSARQNELQNLIDTFPAAWERVHSPEFSKLIALALAVL